MQKDRLFTVLLSRPFQRSRVNRKSLHKGRNGYAEILYIMQGLYDIKARNIRFIETDGVFCGNRLSVSR